MNEVNVDELIRDLLGDEASENITEVPSENITTESLEAIEENTNIPEPEEVLNTHEEIKPNSESLLFDESSSRFSSAIWYDKIKTKQVILAGVGGIGSYCAFLLARLKIYNLVLFDDDTVDASNMSGQLFGLTDINKSKVFAMSSMMTNYADYYGITAIGEKYKENSNTSDIMICGFDNMRARNIYFNNWLNHVNKSNNKSECLFIDGRLAAEEFQVLCIKGDDTYAIERYKKEFLFSDTEADESVCSYKQTTFMANMIASVMINLFVNFVANQCNPLIDRDLPFYTMYNAETMYFKTES